MSKLILLVLDSFGIGAMNDTDSRLPEDKNANTYKHIRENAKKLNINTLNNLGLGALTGKDRAPDHAYGSSKLVHYYADSYMGHQEIVGSHPKSPKKRLMKDVHENLFNKLNDFGYKVEYPIKDCPVLLVEESVVVGDNLESTIGNIINVSADLSIISFENVKKIGEVIRNNVDTSRVITFGGPHTTIENILSEVKQKKDAQWGVDTPKTGIYGEDYKVVHMGYGVNIDGQFQKIAEKSDVKIYRIGKTADIIAANGPAYPYVETEKVLSKLENLYIEEKSDAAFLVNVQETDLAGHDENVEWYADRLNIVDRWLSNFISKMEADDIVFIMADHGNDPTIGHSNHTRELVPLLIYGNKVRKVNIGERDSMADVGATFCDFFNLKQTDEGTSFLREIL